MADSAAPFNILVVDENPAVSRFVEIAVGSATVRVAGATDGLAALELVERTSPNLVLASTDGLENRDLVALLSRRSLNVVPLVGSLSASAAVPDAAAADVLVKPLKVEQLRSLVSRLTAGEALPPLEIVPPALFTASHVVVSDPPVDFPSPPRGDVIETWMSDIDERLGFMRNPQSHRAYR